MRKPKLRVVERINGRLCIDLSSPNQQQHFLKPRTAFKAGDKVTASFLRMESLKGDLRSIYRLTSEDGKLCEETHLS
jgi:hypothetical protein